MALISPESQGILDVRASLTNECEPLSYSLFVIRTVTSMAPIWIEAICFSFAFVPVIVGGARLHGMFALSKFHWEKCKKVFYISKHLIHCLLQLATSVNFFWYHNFQFTTTVVNTCMKRNQYKVQHQKLFPCTVTCIRANECKERLFLTESCYSLPCGSRCV